MTSITEPRPSATPNPNPRTRAGTPVTNHNSFILWPLLFSAANSRVHYLWQGTHKNPDPPLAASGSDPGFVFSRTLCHSRPAPAVIVSRCAAFIFQEIKSGGVVVGCGGVVLRAYNTDA